VAHSLIDEVKAWLSKKVGGESLQLLRVTIDPDQVPLPTTQTTDTTGTTVGFPKTSVGAAGISLGNAGKVITLALAGNLDTKENVLASWDGGTTFTTIPPGGIVGWPPKGGITAFVIKAEPTKTVEYMALLNTVP